ncbi:HNH endonuclease family protein [Nocardia jiangsuensis]|uniref:HNH endonuclease family protein n=1 Tax=Nocardia jiangsuensis TaxID=1691563 RepID=A0ABV8E2A4_9NOCA
MGIVVNLSPVRRGARRAFAVVVPLLVAGVLTGCTATEQPGAPGKQGPVSSAGVPAADATALLGQLKVAPEAEMAGYDRDKFPHWDTAPLDHGFGPEFAQYAKCTTRDVMMLRDATGPVTLDPKSCELSIGREGGWHDHYGVVDRKTGKLKPYAFITDPSKVDAEHIVPLAEAWRSGAGAKDLETRRAIANDATNLAASDPTANRSKGDQDVSSYLPPGEFRCTYVVHYLRIKVKYGLTVDSAEQAALKTAIDDCVSRGGFA